MPGYSGTPLAKKLGIKPGQSLAWLAPPPSYLATLGPSPRDAARLDDDGNGPDDGPLDFIHAFFPDRASLERALPRLRDRLAPAGMLWLSWPKKASGVPTDLSDGVVREAGLAAGLVDVKVCAVDETWSGLKFVIPVKDRPGKTPAAPSRSTGAGLGPK